MKRILLASLLSLMASWCAAAAEDNVLNLYTWSGVVPEETIRQFEKETGIKVNFSTYDSNEIMYAKLKASKMPGYDVIEPSSYYIDRMRRQQMLEPIDKKQLTNFSNLDPAFLNQAYDPGNQYSVPFIWGTTGIFVNKRYYQPRQVTRWTDLWKRQYKSQLLLLDDSREVFSIALRTLGYSINDSNPKHIKQAYLKLKELLPNVKMFKSDGMVTILIDEDANIGMTWNGEFYKAQQENTDLAFVYPQDGFAIWVDNFAIPKNAPHRENAHKFLNFMLRANVAAAASLNNNYPTANLAAKKLLPKKIRNNLTVYPTRETLRRGEFQQDINDAALALYEKYWERLKMGG